jgi:hypothetical protein
MTLEMRRIALWSVAALVATASCFEVPFITETFASELSVSSLAGPLTIGDTTRLNVSALYNVAESDAGPQPRRSSLVHPEDYEFKALDPGIATVDALGVVRGIAGGTASISIKYSHVTDTSSLQVVPVVHAVTLSPTSGTVNFNGSISFDATAVDAQQQALASIPFAFSVSSPSVSNSLVVVTSAPVSPTTTRFTVSATGGVQFTITIRATNARPDRERSATYTLNVNG